MKKKNRTILFASLFASTFLIIASLQVMVNPTCGICVEQKGKSLDAYPTTPEGVVEAFVKASFNGVGIRAVGGATEMLLQYTTWTSYPSCDGFSIALKYNVIKLKEDLGKATVKVVYDCVGEESRLKFLRIERKTEEVIYELEKVKNFWKIWFPGECPYISVKTTIKLMEWGIKYYKDDKERVEWMKEHIEILKKYL